MAQLLQQSDRARDLPQLHTAGWQLAEGRDAITIALKFKDFSQAWAAMSRIALAAETMDHHPEWSNVYNRLTITLTTHSCDGLSDLDVKLAHKIDLICASQGGAVIKAS
jgi:4a-hydroxytetrahydrobiopterin dehydratase